MGKGLSLGMIEMYVDLVKKEYEPLISMLKAKSEAMRSKIEIQVKKDFGIYNMLAELEAIDIRREEIKDKLKEFNDNYWSSNGNLCKVDQEVNRRVREMFTPLAEAEIAQEAALKKIKLMGAGDDVKKIFDNLTEEIRLLTDSFKALPEFQEQKQITVQ